MFRSAVGAFIPVLLLASAVSAEIIDPVFVRGNKNRDNGWFDHLGAFESASDMVKYQNEFWTHAMANPNYGDYGFNELNGKSTFFDGTNYYWVNHPAGGSSFYLHNYGPNLFNMMHNSGADTRTFTRSDYGAGGTAGIWFGDSEGGIYNAYCREHDLIHSTFDTIRRYASIADVLNDNGTTYGNIDYSNNDRFLCVNGKYYRTNTVTSHVVGIAEYDSFADLLAGNQSATHVGGLGASYDLFMAVPRAALGLTGFHSPVPEIDPAGMGSILALLGGGLGLLERRRKRA